VAEPRPEQQVRGEAGEPAEVQVTLYEFVGGPAWFEQLVDRFYAGVAADPVLRPLYPEQDLQGARSRLTGFLIQYWGGPGDYSRQRGHPRLRMRHAPYPIGVEQRDRWLVHMTGAVKASSLPAEVEEVVLGYFEHAADAMMNRIGPT
jgi:hemoglobin